MSRRSIVLVLLVTCTDAFFPNRLTGIYFGSDTYTHHDITEIGILRAVALYFEDHPRHESKLSPGDLSGMTEITSMKLFQAYYGASATGFQLQNTIDDIVTANNAYYKDIHRAVLHFNGETIKEGNELMTDLRDQIISVLNGTNINFDLATQLIGQYLHMMQMFYSNTNWVELFGDKVYDALGIRGKPLLPQVPVWMDACESCGDSMPTNCLNTLILGGTILTSGYRSGQDIKKPYRDPTKYSLGKCSHGGQLDTSGRTSAALGGINKDSTMSNLSPNHHHHHQAAQAAIKHTIAFFNDKNYGLRYVVGEKIFEKFFQLKSGTSLVFTIDYTGSMADDIAAVKQQVIKLTQRSQHDIHKPSNYVIVLFNDPASLTKVFQSEDSAATIRYISQIKVSGGGDCPEYSLTGIEKALSVCHPNSKMYIFTDASAKDSYLFNDVMSQASQKNVRLIFFRTGSCSKRRRRGASQSLIPLNISKVEERKDTPKRSDRNKRAVPIGDLYEALASATGGATYSTTKGGIAQLANIIQETATSTVTIMKRTLHSSLAEEDYKIPVNVDNTTRQLSVQVTGLAAGFYTFIIDPEGNHSRYQFTNIGIGKVFTIDMPMPGNWTVELQGRGSPKVKVTAESTLDITSSFVQLDSLTGFYYEIIGRPVAGDKATIIMYVPSKSLVTGIDSIQLLDTDGTVIRSEQTDNIPSRGDTALYIVKFHLPEKAFQVSVEGEDSEGNRFTRLQNKMIIPVSIHLALLPMNDTLYINETETFEFIVTNKGGNTSEITVEVSDDLNFAQDPKTHTFVLEPQHNASGNFTLQAGSSPGLISTVTVSAKTHSSSGDGSQFVIKRILTKEMSVRVEDNTNPFCNVTSISGKCDASKLDPCTCSQYKWTGSADILDEGVGLYMISSSLKDGGMFSHDNFTYGYNDTVGVEIQGDCCEPRVYITAVDMVSNTGLCVLDLAPPDAELPLSQCKPVTPGVKMQSNEKTIIIAVSSAVVGVTVIVIISVVCVIRKRKAKINENAYPLPSY